jgi:hypothetical protein
MLLSYTKSFASIISSAPSSTLWVTTPQITTAFRDVQREVLDENELYNFPTLQLVKDGGIRWRNVYLILLRCHELREPIRRYFRQARADSYITVSDSYHHAPDALTEDDWDEVVTIKNLLQLFY